MQEMETYEQTQKHIDHRKADEPGIRPTMGGTEIMKTPRVSICLPNLNTRPYLEERIATIEAQTFSDWELVIFDNHSEDGAWEFFQEVAERLPNVRLSQAPREGLYANWNNCIRAARGEFVYIATSDDTMAPDCLEKMVAALDRNPDCDLAHCPMKVIDSEGNDAFDWWVGSSLFARSSGEWLHKPHKRIAPFDGLLCLLGDNVYSSVTQLLIRRSLFDKVGLYRADWGSVGDLHWNMKAGLAASAVHVPDTWGGWRMHDSQATASVLFGSQEHDRKIETMIADALDSGDGLPAPLVAKARELREFLRVFCRLEDPAERRKLVLRQAIAGKQPAWNYLSSLLPGKNRWPKAAPEELQHWVEGGGIRPLS